MHRNKYNVRALRLDLDDCARNGLWNKFRNKVSSLRVAERGGSSSSSSSSSSSLLQAVVVLSCSKTSRQRRAASSGTLLHVVLNLYHKTKKTCNADSSSLLLGEILTLLSDAVPEALFVTAHGKTPLHMAIERQYPASIVQILLERTCTEMMLSAENSNSSVHNINPLCMVDCQGETPLLKAVKQQDHDGCHAADYVELLLRYDTNKQSTLVKSTRKGRRTALSYAVTFEIRTAPSCHENGSYTLSEDVQSLFLATHEALLVTRAPVTPTRNHKRDEHEPINDFNDPLHPNVAATTTSNPVDTEDTKQTTTAHQVLKALATCAPLLEKYAVKLLALLLSSSRFYQQAALVAGGRENDCFLHQLCRQDTPAEHGAATTNSLLMEQLIRFLSLQQQQQEPGNALTRMLGVSDQDGNVPLHLAVATSKDYAMTLVQAYPAALRHENLAKELPLHVALKTTTTTSDGTDGSFLAQELWQADSGTLYIRDGPTNLYPFALAATRQSSADLVYRLLLAAPEVLCDFLAATSL